MTGSIKMRHLGLMILTFVFCVALVGCGGSKVTKENSAKIKPGMSEKEVKDILGEPTETKDMGKGKSMTWKSGDETITVAFDDGKSTMKLSSFELKDALKK